MSRLGAGQGPWFSTEGELEANGLADVFREAAPLSGEFPPMAAPRVPTRTSPPSGARPSSARDHSERDQTPRASGSTLQEGEIDLSDAGDVHDTIPAPPWFSEDEPVG